ncbi:peptide-methionine (S)-S-oxide reductase, partial [Enterobacter hormaechei]
LTRFQEAMQAAGDKRQVTTEIATAKPFYYAEDDHQQYLHKNPYGYCGIGGIGVCLPPQQD